MVVGGGRSVPDARRVTGGQIYTHGTKRIRVLRSFLVIRLWKHLSTECRCQWWSSGKDHIVIDSHERHYMIGHARALRYILLCAQPGFAVRYVPPDSPGYRQGDRQDPAFLRATLHASGDQICVW